MAFSRSSVLRFLGNPMNSCVLSSVTSSMREATSSPNVPAINSLGTQAGLRNGRLNAASTTVRRAKQKLPTDFEGSNQKLESNLNYAAAAAERSFKPAI